MSAPEATTTSAVEAEVEILDKGSECCIAEAPSKSEDQPQIEAKSVLENGDTKNKEAETKTESQTSNQSNGNENKDSTNNQETPSNLPICKPCNLVFGSEEDLKNHNGGKNHNMVTGGFKPPFGSYYCFLCWRGYSEKKDLKSHIEGNAHVKAVKASNVSAIYIDVTEGAESSEKNGLKEDSRKRRRSNENGEDADSKYSQSKRSRAIKAAEETRAALRKFKCSDCNLVFVSERSERLHKDSERHKAVAEERKRPVAVSIDVKGDSKRTVKARYCCFLCWVGYDGERNLFEHYESDEHVNRLIKYGVKCLLEDERINHPRFYKRSPSPRNFMLEECIILDEEKNVETATTTTAEVSGKSASTEAIVEDTSVTSSTPIPPAEANETSTDKNRNSDVNRKSSNNSENAEVIELEVAEEEEGSNNEAEDSTNQIVVLDEIKENDEEDISSTPSIEPFDEASSSPPPTVSEAGGGTSSSQPQPSATSVQ